MPILFLFLAVFIALTATPLPRPRFSEPVDYHSFIISGSQLPAETSQARPLSLPAKINLILQVEEMPGIGDPMSFWEVAYEIRVADWSAVEAKAKSGSTQEIGEVLLRSSFPHRDLLQHENRIERISVPVTGPLLERLKGHPQNAQAFLLRSTVRLFDAKLDRDYAFKLNRIWQFELFPNGEAKIIIKIEPDGSYTTLGPMPKQLPAGYTTIGVSPAKDPPARKP